MHSSHQQFGQQEQFPYKEARDYSDSSSIIEAFPHLQMVNANIDWSQCRDAAGVIIRSANDDNVHKAIKYGIWTTTHKNRQRLEQLYHNSQAEGKEVYLFFSVVKSGMFEGVARLISGLREDVFPYWWDDFSHKFRNYFHIEWLYIKDVNYHHFDGIQSEDGEEVTKCKDCDQLNFNATMTMLEIFNKKPIKGKWIFNDFAFMDKREKQYTRSFQSPQQELSGYGNNYGNSFSYMQAPMMPMMPMPPQMLKPAPKLSSSEMGFQKNPTTQNRKK